jgi:hypothetical protein
MKVVRLTVLAALVAATVLVAASTASAGTRYPTLGDASMQPLFTKISGADPLPSTMTIPHWFSTLTDPTNGVTYGYNMVGATDPRSPKAAKTTIPTDVIPINLTYAGSGGYQFNGTDVVKAVMASPLFKASDYSTTPLSTGGAGELSTGNTGVQYEDAIMRSQFNKVGSRYHLVLAPTVQPTVSITVPSGSGAVYQSERGVPFGLVNYSWFAGRIKNSVQSLKLDPTHLPVFVTNNSMLYITSPDNCCIIGFHGAGANAGGNGNQAVNTFAWGSYTTPGTFDLAFLQNNGTESGGYFVRDIHALSHEIAEWGDDPFINNTVNPWLTPTAPQYGCTAYLETGDPVVGVGFAMTGNSFDSNQYADGYWHPEDEALLPWFARENPNVTSQPIQGGSTGRYAFMGTLNPFPGFQVPATGC